MSKRTFTVLCAVIVALAFSSDRLRAQAFDGYQLETSADLGILDAGEGYGGGFSAPTVPWLWARVAVSTRRTRGSVEGPACSGSITCEDFTLSYDTNFDERGFSLMPTLGPWWGARLSAGPTLAVGQTRADFIAPEGFTPQVFVPGSGHIGYGLTVELVLQPLEIIPLAFKASWSRRRFHLDGCAAPDSRARPFCADVVLTDLRLGGAIILGGR